MMSKIIKCLVLLLLSVSCAPKVYIIDQRTVIEEDASGDWPEFNEISQKNQKKEGVIFYKNDEDNQKKKRVLNLINDEFSL
ncbi:MAG: hypothetical protein KDE33_29145 [Bacteroidetes bacterium]|nr:hypothetical protein [Bacteroidota bacterium]